MQKASWLATAFVAAVIPLHARAVCTQPNGTYSGAFNGAYYDAYGNLVNAASSVITLVFNSSGGGTETEVGKQLYSGVYLFQVSFPAIGTPSHSFDRAACRGVVTFQNGRRYVYVVTDSGSRIQGTYFGDDKLLLVSTFTLSKV